MTLILFHFTSWPHPFTYSCISGENLALFFIKGLGGRVSNISHRRAHRRTECALLFQESFKRDFNPITAFESEGVIHKTKQKVEKERKRLWCF